MKLNKWVSALVLALVLCMVGSFALAADVEFPGNGTYATLADAIAAAGDGGTVIITENISVGTVYINSNVTIEGVNKNITVTATSDKLFRISHNGSSDVQGTNYTVNFSNLTMDTSIKEGRLVDTRGGNTTVNISNCKLTTSGSSISQAITLGGSDTQRTVILNITDSTNIEAGEGDYAIIAFVPSKIKIDDSNVSGYTGAYFKPGSDNSQITLNRSTLSSFYESTHPSNSMAAIISDASGIAVTVNDSTVSASKGSGTTPQTAVCFREGGPGTITVNGNSVLASDTEGEMLTYGVDVTMHLNGGWFSDDPLALAQASSKLKVVMNPNLQAVLDSNGLYHFVRTSYSAPKTGDNSQVLLWAGLMIVSVLGMVAAKKRVAAR